MRQQKLRKQINLTITLQVLVRHKRKFKNKRACGYI